MIQTTNLSIMTLIPDSYTCCCRSTFGSTDRTSTPSSFMKRLMPMTRSSTLTTLTILPSKIQIHKSVHVLCILFVVFLQVGCGSTSSAPPSTFTVNSKSIPYPFRQQQKQRWQQPDKFNEFDWTPSSGPLSSNWSKNIRRLGPAQVPLTQVASDKKVQTSKLLQRITAVSQKRVNVTDVGTVKSTSSDALSSRTLDISSFLAPRFFLSPLRFYFRFLMRQWTRVWSIYTWWLPEVDLAKCFYQTATGQSLDKQLRDKAKHVLLVVFDKLREIFTPHPPDPPPVYSEPHYVVGPSDYPPVYTFKELQDIAYYQAYKDITGNLDSYSQFPSPESIVKVSTETIPYRRQDDPTKQTESTQIRRNTLKLYPVYVPQKTTQQQLVPDALRPLLPVLWQRSSSNEIVADDKNAINRNNHLVNPINTVTVHESKSASGGSTAKQNRTEAVTIVTAITEESLKATGRSGGLSGGYSASDSLNKNSINAYNNQNNLMGRRSLSRQRREQRQYEYAQLDQTGPYYTYGDHNGIDDYKGTIEVAHHEPAPPPPSTQYASTHQEWIDYFQQLVLAKFGLIDQVKQPDTYLACAQSYAFVALLRLVDSIVARL